MDLWSEHGAAVLDVARHVIRDALAQRPPTVSEDLHPVFHQHAGCFVSLHALLDHRLRGCVGRIDATRPLIEALRSAAVHVLEDPRFTDNPVRLEELADLELEVSVLSPTHPVDNSLDFDPLRDGIYLTFGARTGCFLPQVARETGWTREQLLDRLCAEKLGLPTSTWRHPHAKLHVFSVTVIGPEPFERSRQVDE
jgi:AmmeMemoRadiSam system protein A